jgi:hypothetical protein
VPHLSAAEELNRYKRGLKPDVRRRVEIQGCTTTEDGMRLAELLNTISYYNQRTAPFYSSGSPSPYGAWRHRHERPPPPCRRRPSTLCKRQPAAGRRCIPATPPTTTLRRRHSRPHTPERWRTLLSSGQQRLPLLPPGWPLGRGLPCQAATPAQCRRFPATPLGKRLGPGLSAPGDRIGVPSSSPQLAGLRPHQSHQIATPMTDRRLQTSAPPAPAATAPPLPLLPLPALHRHDSGSIAHAAVPPARTANYCEGALSTAPAADNRDWRLLHDSDSPSTAASVDSDNLDPAPARHAEQQGTPCQLCCQLCRQQLPRCGLLPQWLPSRRLASQRPPRQWPALLQCKAHHLLQQQQHSSLQLHRQPPPTRQMQLSLLQRSA